MHVLSVHFYSLTSIPFNYCKIDTTFLHLYVYVILSASLSILQVHNGLHTVCVVISPGNPCKIRKSFCRSLCFVCSILALCLFTRIMLFDRFLLLLSVNYVAWYCMELSLCLEIIYKCKCISYFLDCCVFGYISNKHVIFFMFQFCLSDLLHCFSLHVVMIWCKSTLYPQPQLVFTFCKLHSNDFHTILLDTSSV